MTPAIQLEILDLRHFPAAELKPVLDAETRLWRERLRWDYRASASLLLQYLDSRILPGFVALERGRVRGYVFCVYERNKAVIGDVFAAPPAGRSPEGEPATAVQDRLIEHILALLQNSPGVDRIESQLLLHAHGTHSGALASHGFQIHERLFMELGIPASPGKAAPVIPAGLELRPWRDSDFAAAGRLITRAYEGHLDSRINDQYRSAAGSLRFLHNIVRFPGCGVFDAALSRVLAFRGQDELAALVLCSRVDDAVGHVTQICVDQPHRGRGLGRFLLTECIRAIESRGFEALTLTVTRDNANAVRLYQSLGFITRHAFDAAVWERQG